MTVKIKFTFILSQGILSYEIVARIQFLISKNSVLLLGKLSLDFLMTTENSFAGHSSSGLFFKGEFFEVKVFRKVLRKDGIFLQGVLKRGILSCKTNFSREVNFSVKGLFVNSNSKKFSPKCLLFSIVYRL
jgi:hypothetical protein